MSRATVAILASGEGTTAEAVIEASVRGEIPVDVGLIISNNPKAGIFERVRRLNQQHNLKIACEHISHRNYPAPSDQLLKGAQTSTEEQAILELLEAGTYDLICLMGYMKRVGPQLVKRFGWRDDYTTPYQAMMLNTHPGLLPDTKGLYGIHVQQYVLDQKLPFSGQTLHVVAENYDEGPVIAEHRVAVLPDDTAESLFDRVRQAEKQFLPGDITVFIKQRRKYLEKRV